MRDPATFKWPQNGSIVICIPTEKLYRILIFRSRDLRCVSVIVNLLPRICSVKVPELYVKIRSYQCRIIKRGCIGKSRILVKI